MADETEKITYEIVVDGSKAVASGKQAADAFKNVADSQKAASSSSKDYSAALDKLAPGLESTVKGAGGVLNSFKALIASPIGLVLTAVAGAFTVIKAAIEKSEPALDFIEDIMTKISQTADTLLSNLQLVGDFFGNILVGNLDAAGDAFNKLSEEINKNNAEAQKYLDLSRELEDAQFAFKLSTADTENQIKALIIASKNRNLTFDESQAKIQQAIDLEKGLTETRTKLANQEAEIGVGRIALARGVRKEEGETFDAFVNRIVKSGQFSKDENEKIVGFYEKAKQAASDSLGFQEKAQNQLDAISEKRKADAAKEGERLIAADELEKQISREKVDRAWKEEQELNKIGLEALARIEARAEAEAELSDQVNTANQVELDNEKEASDDSYETEKKRMAKEKELLSQSVANRKSFASQIGATILELAGKNKALALVGLAIEKASAIAQIIANTAIANAKAVAASPLTFGMPWVAINTASAAFAIGSTVAQAITSASEIAGFADGGLTGTKIMGGMGKRIYRGNGDNMLATVKEGEVILNQRHQQMLGGDATFAALGVPGFAGSGIASPLEVNALQTQINSDNLFRNLIQAVNGQAQRVLVIEDVESLMRQRVDIRENATI